jgi:probable rRNA maturation factor
MAVDVFVADEQGDRPVDLDRWVALARAVLEDRGIEGEAEVSLLFVDEVAIAQLNEEFLHRSGPTDVLAFPIEEDVAPGGRSPDLGGTGPGSEPAEEPPMLLGDVVICPAVAARNAAEHGVTVDDELALLVVHGLLHLLGMDHTADAEAERMEALERTLLGRHYDGGAAGKAAK